MAKTGRPQSYTTEDIIKIINQYIRFTDGKVLLNASKIAEYAQKELYLDNFKYYVINRNPDTKAYLIEMNNKIKECFATGKSDTVSIYRTIDVAAISKLSGQKLLDALSAINSYAEELNERYMQLINENIKLKSVDGKMCMVSQVEELQNQIAVLKEKNKVLMNTNGELKNNYEKLLESVMIAWDTEAEKVLKTVGLFCGDEEPDSNAIVTSTKANITSIDAAKKRSKFLEQLEDL